MAAVSLLLRNSDFKLVFFVPITIICNFYVVSGKIGKTRGAEEPNLRLSDTLPTKYGRYMGVGPGCSKVEQCYPADKSLSTGELLSTLIEVSTVNSTIQPFNNWGLASGRLSWFSW